MEAPAHRPHRQRTQGRQAVTEAPAEHLREASLPAIPAEVPQEATDPQALPTDLPQAVTILPAQREVPAAAPQTGVPTLPAAQAAVIPAVPTAEEDRPEAPEVPTAEEAAQEAGAEEGNH